MDGSRYHNAKTAHNYFFVPFGKAAEPLKSRRNPFLIKKSAAWIDHRLLLAVVLYNFSRGLYGNTYIFFFFSWLWLENCLKLRYGSLKLPSSTLKKKNFYVWPDRPRRQLYNNTTGNISRSSLPAVILYKRLIFSTF